VVSDRSEHMDMRHTNDSVIASITNICLFTRSDWYRSVRLFYKQSHAPTEQKLFLVALNMNKSAGSPRSVSKFSATDKLMLSCFVE